MTSRPVTPTPAGTQPMESEGSGKIANEKSTWRKHKITAGSLLKIPIFGVAAIFTIALSPLLLIAAGTTYLVAKNNKAVYSVVLNKILLDSRTPRTPGEIEASKSESLGKIKAPTKIDVSRNEKIKVITQKFFEKIKLNDSITNNTPLSPSDFDDMRADLIALFRDANIEEGQIGAHVNTIIEEFTNKIKEEQDVTREGPKKGKKKEKDYTQEMSQFITQRISKRIDHDSLFQPTSIATRNSKVTLDAYTILNPDQRKLPREQQKWIVFHLAKGATYESQLDMLHAMGRQTGANVLVYNYRGVGKSTDIPGTPPTEKDLIDDGEDVVRHLTFQGVPDENMMLIGHSQGGAIAAQVAARHQNEGHAMHLAVMHTYRRYSEAAGGIMPPGLSFVGKLFAKTIEQRWKFDTEEVLKNFKGHVITVENPDDRIVKTRLKVENAVNRTHIEMSTQEPKTEGRVTVKERFLSLLISKKGRHAHEVTIYDRDADEGAVNRFSGAVRTAFASVPKVPQSAG